MAKHNKFIFGFVEVTTDTVETNKDDYVLSTISVASVRRPFLAPAIVLSGALTLFAGGFADLLYASEVIIILAFIAFAVGAGLQIAQLKLLSRDLRGSELGDVIWGKHSALQKVRRDIVGNIRNANQRFNDHKHDGGAL